MNTLQDQVVLITGAGKGIGRALAIAFASREAIVAANDITPINLDTTLEEITTQGGRAKDYIADIAKKMPLQAMVNQVLDDWGRIDILITNARVMPAAPILEMDEWDWRRTVEVNLTANFLALQSVGQVMRKAGRGLIILLVGEQRPGENYAAYQASNAALEVLALEAAREFWPYQIRIHAICTLNKSWQDVCQVVLSLADRTAHPTTRQTFDPGDVLVQ